MSTIREWLIKFKPLFSLPIAIRARLIPLNFLIGTDDDNPSPSSSHPLPLGVTSYMSELHFPCKREQNEPYIHDTSFPMDIREYVHTYMYIHSLIRDLVDVLSNRDYWRLQYMKYERRCPYYDRCYLSSYIDHYIDCERERKDERGKEKTKRTERKHLFCPKV